MQQENDSTYVQRREIKDFSIPDDIKLQAALKGMTVEEYLKFVDESSKNAKQSGVIVDDSNPQPFKTKVSRNPNEQARIAESEKKAKEEAGKVIDTILNLSLPSTYVNAGLQAAGKEELPEWGSLAVDFAPMVLGVGAGVGKRLLNNSLSKGTKLARELDRSIRNTTLQPSVTDQAVLRGQLGRAPKQTIGHEGQIIQDLPLHSTTPSSKTSLAFFEREPAKISEAERLGIPKGDRGNLSRFQKEALEDLAAYRNKWIYQQHPKLDNNGNIIWSNGTNKLFLDTYVSPLLGAEYKGVQLYPTIGDDGSYLMRMSMNNDKLNGGSAGYSMSGITLTSPKMNAINQEISIPVEKASPTLPKEGVKTFWSALQDIAQPGSYISGDYVNFPLGYNLIRQYKKINTPIISKTNTGVTTLIGRNRYQNIINELFKKTPWKSHYDGLSTDSYMALLKQGNRPGYKLRFSKDGFINWNHQSFENKYIQDLYEQALTNPTKQQEFLKVFHNWIAPYGGHDAVIKNGKIIIPQPFIVRQKSGGNLNYTKLYK